MDEDIIPVKLNALKHHVSFLCSKMEEWRASGWGTVKEALLELGNNQFDMYLGNILPGEICREVDRQLLQLGICSRDGLHRWLGRSGYKTLMISDGSSWVIRESEPGIRYAHVHPSRNQPAVKRIRSTHLKTAVAVIYEIRDGEDPVPGLTTSRINEIRTRRLELSPVKSLNESRKITETIRFFLYFHHS